MAPRGLEATCRLKSRHGTHECVRHNCLVGVVIPTLNAGPALGRLLLPLVSSRLRPRVLVVDSSSTDGTGVLARSVGAEVVSIDRAGFNHGATREFARKFLGTPVVAMMTQDAYPAHDDLLEVLVAPILSGSAAVAYARQVPNVGAPLLEAFPRRFNYPEQSQLRSLADRETMGSLVYFCSNACAAYDNASLDAVGGFPRVLTAEDTLVVSRLLALGHRIAYVAEAVVRHSHRYSLWQEFRRHFDTGYMRAGEPDAFESGADSRNGRAYARSLLAAAWREAPWIIPYAVTTLAVKYGGYVLGRAGRRLPARVCRLLSANREYWAQEKESAVTGQGLGQTGNEFGCG